MSRGGEGGTQRAGLAPWAKASQAGKGRVPVSVAMVMACSSLGGSVCTQCLM